MDKQMGHFTIWDWADFARGVADNRARVAMQSHLASGCGKCDRTVRMFRDVSTVARAESLYEPPEHVMRYAQALYSLHRPEPTGFKKLIAHLIHDTALVPQPAGLRAQGQTSSHLLYEAGPYYLDIQVEQEPRSERMSLVGQITPREDAAASTANLPVWLLERETLLASTLSNHFGEFQLEFPPTRSLLLRVPLPDADTRIDVSLSQPLARLYGHRAPARIKAPRSRRRR